METYNSEKVKVGTACSVLDLLKPSATAFVRPTLESGIDVGQGITIGPGKFVKKNKRRVLNKRRA